MNMDTTMPAYLLDPWENAAEIANQLNNPGTALVIGLGAEWCQRCTDFKPGFLQLAATEKNILWLWYNLEEHEELLGDFYPETLPLVWVYQGPKLIRYGTPDDSSPNQAHDLVEFINRIPVMTSAPSPTNDIRHYLVTPNWAQ